MPLVLGLKLFFGGAAVGGVVGVGTGFAAGEGATAVGTMVKWGAAAVIAGYAFQAAKSAKVI